MLTQLDGEHYPGRNSELAEYVLKVRVDGAARNEQPPRDLLVGQPGRDQPGDLPLAGREPARQPGPRLRVTAGAGAGRPFGVIRGAGACRERGLVERQGGKLAERLPAA